MQSMTEQRSAAAATLSRELGPKYEIAEGFSVQTKLGPVKLDVVVLIAQSRAPIAAFKLRRKPGSLREKRYDAALIPWRYFDVSAALWVKKSATEAKEWAVELGDARTMKVKQADLKGVPSRRRPRRIPLAS